MLKHIIRILCCIALVLLLSFVLGFFTLGVWAIYGRTIAFWALAFVCAVLVVVGARER